MTLSLTRVRARPNRSRQINGLRLIFKVWAERRALSQLSNSRLRDLGLTPSDVAREAARPVWDLPRR